MLCINNRHIVQKGEKSSEKSWEKKNGVNEEKALSEMQSI